MARHRCTSRASPSTRSSRVIGSPPACIAAIARVVVTSGANRELVFQCTNRSARYVPRLVEEGAAAMGIATLRVSERYRYGYRALLREPA